MHQFVANCKGYKDKIKQVSESLSAIDQDKVMERTGIGYDAAHLLGNAAEAFEIGSKFFAFARAERLGVLQKAVDCEPVKAKQFTDLSVGDSAFPIGLHNQCFECLTRKIRGLRTQSFY